MRNHQDNGNRYQFRLHPAPPTAPAETSAPANMNQQQQSNNNKPTTIEEEIELEEKQLKMQKQEVQQQQNITNNNLSDKAKISSSIIKCSTNNVLTGSAALKDNNNAPTAASAGLLPRKQFTPSSDGSNASFSSASVAGSIQDDISDQCSLTQAGLEEYNIRASSYYDQPVLYHHQKQSSYAQSEGYHSYVSSSDSSSATPFLDRLRQESDLLSRQSHHWSQNDLSSVSCNSVAPSPVPLSLTLTTTNGRESSMLNGNGGIVCAIDAIANNHQQHNNSSESTSSTETLKWLGSMSDVSEASHATGYSAISESVSTSQLIVHSSRVLTPKRHHSESVLYLNDEQQHSPNSLQHKQPHSPSQISPSLSEREPSPTRLSAPNHRHSPSYPPVHSSVSLHPYQSPRHLFATSKRADTASDVAKSSFLKSAEDPHQQQHKTSISVTISNSEAVVTISPQPPPVVAQKPNSIGSTEAKTNGASVVVISSDSGNAATTTASSANSVSTSLHLPAACPATAPLSVVTSSASSVAVAAPTTPSNAASSSYRSNHRLFPVSTYTEPVHSNTSHYVHHPKPQYSAGLQKPLTQIQQPQQQQQQNAAACSTTNVTVNAPQLINGQAILGVSPTSPPQPSWQSVAELINDFERSTDQQPQKYTYIEPSKTHRVSNPALKAFQKNAVQSYFERQQQQKHQHDQQHKQHSKEYHSSQQQLYHHHQEAHQHHLQQQQQLHQMQRPHSFQATASAKEVTGQQLLRNSLPNTYGGQALSCSTSMRILSPARNSSPNSEHNSAYCALPTKPPSPAPPPPPPRNRSLMPASSLLRRSSSASDYAEFREQYTCASKEKLQAQSVKNISSSEKSSFNDCGMPPPPPPPRGRPSMPARRTSSASEYAAMRDKMLLQQAAALAHQQHHPHQYNQNQPSRPPPHPHYYAPPQPQPPPQSTLDGWVPERPPKNPNLRIPSPDLPPPPAVEDAGLSDEPLPPPPPEILHRQQYYDGVGNTSMGSGVEFLPKAPSPNRRNSFAGSGSGTTAARKNYFNRSASATQENAPPTKAPPLIPKKPSGLELLHAVRPHSSLSQKQASKAHKVTINGGQHHHPPPVPQTAKMNANRKRPHNPNIISVPPILENTTMSNTKLASNTVSATTTKSSPPPLMPRMPSIANHAANVAANNKLRCNSKASYLPRQSLEKLSSTDPDHGSYKLTLTSNEDLVANTKTNAHNGKLPNNLPDVLPLGAKLQQQPASPTSSNGSPLRYGSNNNIAATHSPTHPQQQPCYPIYPAQHRYSTPTMSTSFNHHNNNTQQVPNYARSQSYDLNNAISAKFMSQSTIDLKKTQNLETTLEESHMEHTNILSPAQSENNLSSPTKHSPRPKRLSPYTAREEFHRADIAEGHKELGDGRIFRAELVNTTLSASPCTNNVNSNKPVVTRKDSLRENIEKITQLQSQLMSAHLTDSGGMLCGYAPKVSPKVATADNVKPSDQCIESPQERTSNDNSAEVASEVTEEAAPALPSTPPPTELTEPFSTTDDVLVISQMDTSTDGLKLMQRSEIVLRVNPTTVEASCQTDDLSDCEMGHLTVQLTKEESQTRTTLQPRQRQPIEIECDNLSKELACLLPPNDKLIEILTPPAIKFPSDYVEKLYNPEVPMRPAKRNVGTSTLMRMRSSLKKQEEARPARSVLKMELQYAELEMALSNGSESESCDVLKKKVDELLKQLKRKINILNSEQTTIGEESAINDKLGSNLISKLNDKVRPNEATKLRAYIDDVGHITSLLLSLSERLARADNSLSAIELNNSEKKILESKRERLLEQLEEAKRLKEDIDRRGASVSGMLEKNLTADEFADFDYFINMKAKLIADGRDIADKIKCGEEQLTALGEALMQSDC